MLRRYRVVLDNNPNDPEKTPGKFQFKVRLMINIIYTTYLIFMKKDMKSE